MSMTLTISWTRQGRIIDWAEYHALIHAATVLGLHGICLVLHAAKTKALNVLHLDNTLTHVMHAIAYILYNVDHVQHAPTYNDTSSNPPSYPEPQTLDPDLSTPPRTLWLSMHILSAHAQLLPCAETYISRCRSTYDICAQFQPCL
jgi:hypothetical protein